MLGDGRDMELVRALHGLRDCDNGVAIPPSSGSASFGEAYWWTDVSRTGQYVTMALLGLMNLGLGLADAARGALVVDGELQMGGANLALGSAFIYLFVIAMVQRRRLSRDGEDE